MRLKLPGHKCTLVLLLMICVACLDLFGEGIFKEIHTTNGGRIQILWKGHDDPGLMINVRVLDDRGKGVGEELRLGWVGDIKSLSRNHFQHYEAEHGNVVGLYRIKEPGKVLMIADFERREIFSMHDAYRYESSEARARVIRALSQAAGIELELSEDLVSF